MYKKQFVFFLLFFSTAYVKNLYADSTVSVGRYLTAKSLASPAESDPLQSQYQGTFPQSVHTIGDAVTYLLNFSGYHLIFEKKSVLAQTLNQPLPQSVRTIGPVSIQDGLLAIMGQPYQLLIDPAHRLVSFRLKATYQNLYQEQANV